MTITSLHYLGQPIFSQGAQTELQQQLEMGQITRKKED